jgi:hypothetical protein
LVCASHTLCNSAEATLEDLLACASGPFSSATWRPTHLLHERLGVPKRFDPSGFIIRDPEFWRDYLSRLPDQNTMTLAATPESVVQRQLDAYNARDIEALMATYADDVQQFEYPATLLVSGAAELRERIVARFGEANLHARLIRRIVMGQQVIDHEEVTRTFPEGPGKIELVAIYEVLEGRIAVARFISGTKTLDSEP